MTPFTALVLAGVRPGPPDAVAAHAGVPHKALIVLDGQTLLARVVGALRGAGARRIVVSTNDPDVTAAAAILAVEVLPAAASPSLSVAEAFAALSAPLLVTTSDHALLSAEWIARFLADTPPDCDIAALLAPEAAVRAAAPATRRTYLSFADGRYSGCNLFLLRTAAAAPMIRFWRRVEAERKRPWRVAAMIGPAMLVGYLLRRFTLDAAVSRLGRRAGVIAAAVRTSFGLAAVDVDKPSDLDLVRALVSSRRPA